IGRARRRDDGPDAPARHAERLRRATDGDGALAHPGQRRHRDVLPVVVDVLVDLVGHRVGVVSAAQLGDRLEVPARQHAPRRGVRRADDDRAGALRERRPESVDVELCARGDRHEDRFRAAQDRVGPVVLIERLEHDHLVARIDDGEQRRRHRLGRAAGDGHFGLWIDGHAVPLGVLPCQGVTQPLGAPRDGVLVHVVADGAGGGFLQHVGAGEVGEPLRQVDRAVLVREPGHAADYRFGEAVGAVGGVHGTAESSGGESVLRRERRESLRAPGPPVLTRPSGPPALSSCIAPDGQSPVSMPHPRTASKLLRPAGILPQRSSPSGDSRPSSAVAHALRPFLKEHPWVSRTTTRFGGLLLTPSSSLPWLLIATSLTLGACGGGGGGGSPTKPSAPVASVTVTPAAAALAVGATVQLTAATKDAAGNLLAGRTVTWAGSRLAVAMVSGTGLVTGVTGGSATITATSEGKSGTATITVQPSAAAADLFAVGAEASSGAIAVGGGGTILHYDGMTWSLEA